MHGCFARPLRMPTGIPVSVNDIPVDTILPDTLFAVTIDDSPTRLEFAHHHWTGFAIGEMNPPPVIPVLHEKDLFRVPIGSISPTPCPVYPPWAVTAIFFPCAWHPSGRHPRQGSEAEMAPAGAPFGAGRCGFETRMYNRQQAGRRPPPPKKKPAPCGTGRSLHLSMLYARICPKRHCAKKHDSQPGTSPARQGPQRAAEHDFLTSWDSPCSITRPVWPDRRPPNQPG